MRYKLHSIINVIYYGMVWYAILIGCKPCSTCVFKETLSSHGSEDKDYDLPESDAMMVLRQVSLLQKAAYDFKILIY